LDLEIHSAHAAMPPPEGMPPPAFFFGTSATMASVMISSAATEASHQNCDVACWSLADMPLDSGLVRF
jgi:hypothetical protein